MNRKQRLFLIIIVAFIIIAILNIKEIRFLKTSYYRGDLKLEGLQEVVINHSNQAKFKKYMDGLIQYTEGTLRYYDYGGNESWKLLLGISDPIIKTSGDIYIVDGDRNQLIRIDNKGKIVYRYTLEGKVKTIRVGDSDEIVLIYELQGNKEKVITILDKAGRKTSDIKINHGDLIAMDIAMEHNSIAIGIIDTSEDAIETHLLNYDLKGRIISSSSLGEAIIYHMFFDKEGKLIIIKDNEIIAFQKDKEKWKLDIELIKDIMIMNNSTIVLYGEAEKSRQLIKNSGDIIIIQKNGKVSKSEKINEELVGIDYNSNEILAYSKRTIYIMNNNGEILFKQAYHKDIERAFLFEKGHLVIVTKENIYFKKIEKK